MSLTNRKRRGIGTFSSFEKILVVKLILTVPQSDTGGQVEYTKVNGRTIFKELGKKARRIFGRCRASSNRGRSERLSSDCLSKTQGSANLKGEV